METYKTIRLISEAFDRHEIKYQIFEAEQYQEIQASFSIKIGPLVTVHFNSRNKGNDLEIRIIGLINGVPAEKRQNILEVCNTLNERYRFTKFCLNSEGNVSVEYDLPISTGDDCVGEMCFEVFIRLIQILNQGYSMIASALYQDDTIITLNRNNEKMNSLQHMTKDNQDEISIKISRMPSASDVNQETSKENNQQDETIG